MSTAIKEFIGESRTNERMKRALARGPVLSPPPAYPAGPFCVWPRPYAEQICDGCGYANLYCECGPDDADHEIDDLNEKIQEMGWVE